MHRCVRQRRRTDRGASAVEFALVLPFLLAVLMAIVDYGLVFTDSVSMRQGVREAARSGVVSNFSSSCGGSTTLDSLRCRAKDEIGAITGDADIKVYAPDGWTKGKSLVVCARLDDPGIINFVPMPGQLESRVVMSIETEDRPPSGPLSVEDSGDWSWC